MSKMIGFLLLVLLMASSVYALEYDGTACFEDGQYTKLWVDPCTASPNKYFEDNYTWHKKLTNKTGVTQTDLWVGYAMPMQVDANISLWFDPVYDWVTKSYTCEFEYLVDWDYNIGGRNPYYGWCYYTEDNNTPEQGDDYNVVVFKHSFHDYTLNPLVIYWDEYELIEEGHYELVNNLFEYLGYWEEYNQYLYAKKTSFSAGANEVFDWLLSINTDVNKGKWTFAVWKDLQRNCILDFSCTYANIQDPDWFDGGKGRKTEVWVDNSNYIRDLNAYQGRIDLNSELGADFWNFADVNDLIVVNKDQNVQLGHWVEAFSTVDQNGIVWFRTENDIGCPASTLCNFWFYFDEPLAVSDSNFDAVFWNRQGDFDNLNLGQLEGQAGWLEHYDVSGESGEIEVLTSTVFEGTQGAGHEGTITGSEIALRQVINIEDFNFIFEYTTRYEVAGQRSPFITVLAETSTGGYDDAVGGIATITLGNYWKFHTCGTPSAVPTKQMSVSDWHNIKVTVTEGKYKADDNGVSIISSDNGCPIALGDANLIVYNWGEMDGNGYWDRVLVRRHVDVEPTVWTGTTYQIPAEVTVLDPDGNQYINGTYDINILLKKNGGGIDGNVGFDSVQGGVDNNIVSEFTFTDAGNCGTPDGNYDGNSANQFWCAISWNTSLVADGNYYINVVTSDGGSDSSNSSFYVDNTAPSGSILIDDGNLITTDLFVDLTISATDIGSGIYQMRLSNDGATWDNWEAYSTSKLGWNLTGFGGDATEGVKAVYIQFRDNLLNQSGSFTDSITYDATLPEPFRFVPYVNEGSTESFTPEQKTLFNLGQSIESLLSYLIIIVIGVVVLWFISKK